jgi:hypothetical protein
MIKFPQKKTQTQNYYNSIYDVAKFRYLETSITNQNVIQEGIKRRLNSGNACYHSVPEPSVFSFAV